MLKVNGIEITQKQFAYDGCHKIYLLEDNEIADALNNNYEIVPIKKLAEKFVGSCGLRFIDHWNLDKKGVVPQCQVVTNFNDNGKEIVFDTSTDTVNGKNAKRWLAGL